MVEICVYVNTMDRSAIEDENNRLRLSWNWIPESHLATYLGVMEQDQRINTHSILTRALLADTLWPGMFDGLINEELRFGVVMTWFLEQVKSGRDRFKLIDDIFSPARAAAFPAVVQETVAWLQTSSCPITDYASEALMYVPLDEPYSYLSEIALNTFMRLWSSQLADLRADRITVIEIACGSGNDYKAIRDFGLADHISYSGFDICLKNVRNAQVLFPGVNFFEASILDSGLPDNAFDYAFVHDLLGHLSPDGMELALTEIMRIVRKESWIHCYNAADIKSHEIHPFNLYFRNRLSIPKFVESLEKCGASVEVIDISTMLNRKFGFVPDYTASSVSFIAHKKESCG